MSLDPSPEQFRDLMATDDPDLAEVMACVFGVQSHEVRTYRTLLDTPGSTGAEPDPDAGASVAPAPRRTRGYDRCAT